MIAVIRTVVVGVVLGGVALVVYWRVSEGDLRRTMLEMEAIQQEMEQRIAAREAMIERLNRFRRMAHITVTDQQVAPSGEVIQTELEFIELDDDGAELGRQSFTLPGDVLYIDAWSVKFRHEDVADGDPLRGRSLILLRRIYSDQMPPIEGYPIDLPGAVPPGYASGERGEYEKRIWERFWELATDADAAKAMGVRVAQGEAVYKPVRPGLVYELVVDAAGGMSLTPLPETPAASDG